MRMGKWRIFGEHQPNEREWMWFVRVSVRVYVCTNARCCVRNIKYTEYCILNYLMAMRNSVTFYLVRMQFRWPQKRDRARKKNIEKNIQRSRNESCAWRKKSEAKTKQIIVVHNNGGEKRAEHPHKYTGTKTHFAVRSNWIQVVYRFAHTTKEKRKENAKASHGDVCNCDPWNSANNTIAFASDFVFCFERSKAYSKQRRRKIAIDFWEKVRLNVKVIFFLCFIFVAWPQINFT